MTFDRNLDVLYGLSEGQTYSVGCASEGLVDVELSTAPTLTSLQRGKLAKKKYIPRTVACFDYIPSRTLKFLHG